MFDVMYKIFLLGLITHTFNGCLDSHCLVLDINVSDALGGIGVNLKLKSHSWDAKIIQAPAFVTLDEKKTFSVPGKTIKLSSHKGKR